MEFRNCDEKVQFVLRKMVNLRETDVWSYGPSPWGIFTYSFIVPTICSLGIVGNFLILTILRRKTLKASTYTYLAGKVFDDIIVHFYFYIKNFQKKDSLSEVIRNISKIISSIILSKIIYFSQFY